MKEIKEAVLACLRGRLSPKAAAPGESLSLVGAVVEREEEAK